MVTCKAIGLDSQTSGNKMAAPMDEFLKVRDQRTPGEWIQMGSDLGLSLLSQRISRRKRENQLHYLIRETERLSRAHGISLNDAAAIIKEQETIRLDVHKKRLEESLIKRRNAEIEEFSREITSFFNENGGLFPDAQSPNLREVFLYQRQRKYLSLYQNDELTAEQIETLQQIPYWTWDRLKERYIPSGEVFPGRKSSLPSQPVHQALDELRVWDNLGRYVPVDQALTRAGNRLGRIDADVSEVEQRIAEATLQKRSNDCNGLSRYPCRLCSTGFDEHQSFLHHVETDHKGMVEYRKRVFYEAEQRGPYGPPTDVWRHCVTRFSESLSCENPERSEKIPRTETACVVCARRHWSSELRWARLLTRRPPVQSRQNRRGSEPTQGVNSLESDRKDPDEPENMEVEEPVMAEGSGEDPSQIGVAVSDESDAEEAKEQAATKRDSDDAQFPS